MSFSPLYRPPGTGKYRVRIIKPKPHQETRMKVPLKQNLIGLSISVMILYIKQENSLLITRTIIYIRIKEK